MLQLISQTSSEANLYREQSSWTGGMSLCALRCKSAVVHHQICAGMAPPCSCWWLLLHGSLSWPVNRSKQELYWICFSLEIHPKLPYLVLPFKNSKSNKVLQESELLKEKPNARWTWFSVLHGIRSPWKPCQTACCPHQLLPPQSSVSGDLQRSLIISISYKF